MIGASPFACRDGRRGGLFQMERRNPRSGLNALEPHAGNSKKVSANIFYGF